MIFTEGILYAYQGRQDDEMRGVWMEVGAENIEKLLIETFPFGAAAREGVRREIVTRALLPLRRSDAFKECSDAFKEATSGIALMNGFLKYDEQARGVVLVPHSPDHLARNKIGADYKAGQAALVFKQMLLRAFGGDEVRMTVFLEFLGCAIFRTWPAEDKNRTCLILHGPQRSGKSTLIEFAKAFFLESQVTSLAPDLFGKPERNVQLVGSALNVVTELQANKAIKGSIIKQILSHEPIAGRRLYENLFTFTPRCGNIWACNDLPRIDETHPSLMRRFVMVTMGDTLTDAEAAQDFAGAMEAERDGIMALVAQSFVDATTRGKFALPDDSDELVARMQLGDDVAGHFARFRLKGQPGSRVTSEMLQRELRATAIALDLNPDEVVHTGTMKRLAGLMKVQFRAERKSSNGRPFYEGVALQGSSRGHLATGSAVADAATAEGLEGR